MIKLSTLNDIAAAAEQQEAQQSTLARKAAEGAAQPQEYKLTPEAQSIVDEVQAGRERDQIRRRLMLYNDAMMQQAAGPVSPFANGGGIHIDPSKRGTFTAAASRHGMGVQEFAAHVHAHPENYSPAMRRKANFARNAAKWHDAGGPLNMFGVIPAVTSVPMNFNAYGGPVNSYAYAGYIDPNLSIYDALTMAGIPFKTSNPSGYRGPGHYVGKARENSAHAKRRKDGTAYALDITGDFDEIRRRINASKPLQNYFAANGFGVHEELTKEALRKTGGTGPHFHIGLLSGKHVGDSGASYAHSHPGAAADEYPASLPMGPQVLATISPDSSQGGFTPWWSQAGQYDDDFIAQQALGAAGGAYDMSTFVPSWVEPTSTPATFPDLFS